MTLQKYIENYRSIAVHIDTADRIDIDKEWRKMYQVIEDIDANFGEEGIEEFAKLFEIPEHNINLWAAKQLLEAFTPSKEMIVRAFAVVENYANSAAVNADIYKEWLQVWHSNHINEQEYRTRRGFFNKLSIYYAVGLLVAMILSPLLEQYIQIKTVNYLLISFTLLYMVNALYYYLLEKKLKKGIENLTALTCILTMGILMVSIIILIPFTYFKIILEPLHPVIFLSTTFVVSLTLGISVARHFWLKNSWQGRRLPRFRND